MVRLPLPRISLWKVPRGFREASSASRGARVSWFTNFLKTEVCTKRRLDVSLIHPKTNCNGLMAKSMKTRIRFFRSKTLLALFAAMLMGPFYGSSKVHAQEYNIWIRDA